MIRIRTLLQAAAATAATLMMPLAASAQYYDYGYGDQFGNRGGDYGWAGGNGQAAEGGWGDDYGWDYDNGWEYEYGEQDRLGYRESNPYGYGSDVYDDKWDTGRWDMGEFDRSELGYRTETGNYQPYSRWYDNYPSNDAVYPVYGTSDANMYDPYTGDEWYTEDWWEDYDSNQDGWFDW